MPLRNWILGGAMILAATGTAVAAHGDYGRDARPEHREMHRQMHGDGHGMRSDGRYHDRMGRGDEMRQAGRHDGRHGYGHHGRGHHGRHDGPTLRLKMEGRQGEMMFECGASMAECLDALERVQRTMHRQRGMRPGRNGPDGSPDSE